jgi:hypothetical protein
MLTQFLVSFNQEVNLGQNDGPSLPVEAVKCGIAHVKLIRGNE